MNYQETIDWLFSQVPMFHNVGQSAYKPGLDTVERLCQAFGNPQRKFKAIHVGGTNGKGSTSSLLASVLAEDGHTTGLFTSPHLIDFRERIRVNGEMISEEGVVDFISRYRELNLGLEPSFFELTTVMAFDWFARRGCDWAVVEVGLGGRLDSTNIIRPEVSVITNISLDHTALLGSTEPEIAREKAGIIKDNTPVVVGRADGEVMQVFNRAAANHFALVRFAHQLPCYDSATLAPDGSFYTYTHTPWGDLSCPLTGSCQPENVNTALYALAFVPGTTRGAVARGFERVLQNTGLAGRWTVVSQSPLTICDTGHNPGGWAYLGPKLAEIAETSTLHMVIGFVGDKDLRSILAYMPRRARYYFTAPSVERRRPADDTAAEARAAGLQGQVYPTVDQAIAAARAAAAPADTIFVGGSTFVVADFLSSKI